MAAKKAKVRRPKLYAKLRRKGMPEAVARKAANKPSRGSKAAKK